MTDNHNYIETYFDNLFTFDTDLIRDGQIEYCGQQALIKYQIDYTCEEIYIYGGGRIGFYTTAWLKREKCPIKAIIDKDESKNGKKLIGIDIISPKKFMEMSDINTPKLVLIAANLMNEVNEIKRFLFSCNGVRRIIDIDLPRIYDSPASRNAYEIYSNKDEFRKVLLGLYDYDSKKSLCELIRASLYNDFYRGNVQASSEKYFMFINEVCARQNCKIAFVGGGSGDTIYYFLSKEKCFDSITVFDPEPCEIYYNLSFLSQEYLEKITICDRYVGEATSEKVISLDDYYSDGNYPSLITFDIEGSELLAIRGAEKIIEKGKTIFAISAYHRWDDLIQFMKVFNSTKIEYVFAYRKYAALYRMNSNETVLYAVPKSLLRYADSTPAIIGSDSRQYYMN